MPSGLQNPHSRKYYGRELEIVKKEIEEWAGVKITDEKLKGAIDLMNRNRKLLREVYELRKQEKPPLTGTEAMLMTFGVQVTHKEDSNRALEKLLEELPNRKLDRETGSRLLILGSEDDDIEFLNMVETIPTQPATIVIDEHCTGSRYFWNQVEANGNLLQAIANRYCDRPPCPNKDMPERYRIKHILNLAKEWDVAGAIVIQQKFCDPHEADIPTVISKLKENGVPCYFLELDVTVPIGQFRIRVEAFLEMLKAEELPF
jgi:benzoyl-CoA reductase subunit C